MPLFKKQRNEAQERTPVKLTRAEKKEIQAVIRKYKGDGKPHSAQESIPYEAMYQDGICRLTPRRFSKCIEFADISYQLAQADTKTAIFENLCDLYNYLDASIHIQFSFLNHKIDPRQYAKSLEIRAQGDDFDDIRTEYSAILKNQLVSGNNGLMKRKFLTYTIEADNLKLARARLHRIETELMGKFDEGKLPADPHLMLRLAIETVAHDYDVIVIDSAPNLGIGTINVVCAADVLIVPTPAELFDYTSALQFFDMLRDLLKNVDLKGFEPDVRILLTKYSNNNGSQSPWMEEQIRDAWGSMVLKNVVRETDEVGKGQIRMRTVFEQAIDQRSSTGAWRNALSIWEPVCNEIFDRLIKPRWEIR